MSRKNNLAKRKKRHLAELERAKQAKLKREQRAKKRKEAFERKKQKELENPPPLKEVHMTDAPKATFNMANAKVQPIAELSGWSLARAGSPMQVDLESEVRKVIKMKKSSIVTVASNSAPIRRGVRKKRR
eukprot:TRINITY_DN12131_c0_g1_i1.p1 TRINITY_DN12131_c0_g1~~TRINITY_DN12131_c0_g1_i1.p1  ORF type:complete len:130 (-),score=31.84 TRINITY_DN12131_c0_g1_i1:83-472(-)